MTAVSKGEQSTDERSVPQPPVFPVRPSTAPVAPTLALALLLSLLAGYVDTAGYLGLQGLFTAHVTGNFVTIGAALVHGRSGVLTKILALPVFCVFVLTTRLVVNSNKRRGVVLLPELMAVQTFLLAFGGAVIIRYGLFQDGDVPLAIIGGTALVAAMAVQNAAHRIHLSSAPPSTLMTGTTTQIMLDLADLSFRPAADDRAAIQHRLGRMGLTVTFFAAGCGIAALGLFWLGKWCFAVPPLLGVVCGAIAHQSRRVSNG